MARHHVFIVAAKLKAGEGLPGSALCQRLKRLPENSFAFPMVHFASFVILDPETTLQPPMLVMECNVDGPEDDFLRALVGSKNPHFEEIFDCCEGYPNQGDLEAKFGYLKKCVRRPQLFHVGTPWRSVRSIQMDRDLRGRLDQRLRQLGNGSLMADIAVPPTGQHEYWAWEILEPWAACLLGLGGPLIAVWLYGMTSSSALPHWASIALAVLYVALALRSIFKGMALWHHALPELRARVRPWFGWAVVGAACVWLAQWLRSSRPGWAIGIQAAFAVVLAVNIFAAFRRRANARLAAIRVNSDGRRIADIWDQLGALRDGYQSETEWIERLQYWMWWAIVYVAVAAVIWLVQEPRWRIVALIGSVFFLKAVWLAVLAGWPAKGTATGDFARIILFIVLAGAVAAAVTRLFIALAWPPWVWPWLMPALLAALVLIGVFSMWAMPLPSPKPEYRPRRGAVLEKVVRQEDRGVQNHMTAVVVLKEDYPFRVPALKAFLWLLNRLFYRCLAPDWYRGKLFGIPTVHFAQWILLDSRNYLFLSNYDNSWTTYLDDFGTTLSSGLQKVWGQGKGNPGIKDLGRFKEYARTTMVTHAHWYSAYPGLTVRQVWNNREIRRGLAHAAGEEAMVRTLKRVALAPKALPDFYHGRIR